MVGYLATIGPDHASTVSIVHSLAVLFESQDRFDESKAMYERALASRERTFGRDHIKTLHIGCNLGNMLRNVDRIDEARGYYLRALSGYEKAYGANHAETQSVRRELEEIHQHGRVMMETSVATTSVGPPLGESGKAGSVRSTRSRKGSVFAISMRKDK